MQKRSLQVSDKEMITTLQKQIAEPLQQVSRLLQRVSFLEEEKAELKEELYKSNLSSQNSHPPPSRNLHKSANLKGKKKKLFSNPGGQHDLRQPAGKG